MGNIAKSVNNMQNREEAGVVAGGWTPGIFMDRGLCVSLFNS